MSEDIPKYGGRYVMSAAERAALERLIEIAKRDTGQSETVADFLLAWWNAPDLGGFNLARLWAVDTSITNDMLTVCALISRASAYPNEIGYEEDFRTIVRVWRADRIKE